MLQEGHNEYIDYDDDFCLDEEFIPRQVAYSPSRTITYSYGVEPTSVRLVWSDDKKGYLRYVRYPDSDVFRGACTPNPVDYIIMGFIQRELSGSDESPTIH